jgi:hypothetical protein
MNAFRQTDMSRHEYLLAAWKRALFVILGTLLTGGGIFFGFGCSSGPNATVSLVSALFFLVGGIYTIAYALLARVVIEGSRIQVRGAFREQSADLTDIEGYRTVSSRNGTYTQLCLKHGLGTISLSKSFETDGDYSAWFHQLTDLDKRDRDLMLDEIAREEALGSSPNERLSALSIAKTWSVAILVATIAVAVALNFADPDLWIPAAIALALAPIVVLILIRRAPLLYTVMKPRSDPRADLGMILIVAGFGLLIRERGVHLVAQPPILLIAVVIALVYTAGLYSSIQSGNAFIGRLIGLLFFIGVYGHGLAVLADSLPDHSQPQSFTTSVVEKHVSRGGRSTSYVLELAPWGPLQERNSLNVSSREYAHTGIGDQVCLLLHPGALDSQWYERITCSTSRYSSW